MYTNPLAVYMAKLYWRIKKDGKWTWKPAVEIDRGCCEYVKVLPKNWLYLSQEEEV